LEWREALNLAESFHYGRIRITPMQVRSEIEAFLELLVARAPRVVLEIGTADGGTLFLFTRVADPGALMISVDLPGGPFGGGYASWKAALYRSFARPGQEIHLLRGDSHDPSTAKRVTERLGNEPVDLLFIDGDHTYEGVKADFETYSPLVRSGGLIAFHDIVPGSEEAVGGVPRFWDELKRSPGSGEIVADWNQGGYGIGYLTPSR
jgi:cephalosporin hydroxylase